MSKSCTDLHLSISGSALERELPQIPSRPESRSSTISSSKSGYSGCTLGSGALTPGGTSALGVGGRYSLLTIDDKVQGNFERARFWTPQVEDSYRLQFCGWRDANEYRNRYGERHSVDENGNAFISKVQLKENGYFTYW
eukprot:CAMPEP_0169275130 /NCGR_PEP_ID=MMETSP1016-20121227/52147_1 /TAXON_ID=342587 /ORGANISM="Karlodinium micrum, Strain CCMP2283" /LENGTH=138 /DNA_ID=CAMNT_0009361843 /DNA_START=98 /DNA_END=511 /DNA_ORIENTATION=+